jgi:hypothetical protein
VLFQLLEANAACVYYWFGTGDSIKILRGDVAWEVFVADMLERGFFTCFSCRSCRFLHVASSGAGDYTSVTTWKDSGPSNLYYLRRREGPVSPDNWCVDFVCQACGLPNRDVPTTVSYDGGSNKKGNPLVRVSAKE